MSLDWGKYIIVSDGRGLGSLNVLVFVSGGIAKVGANALMLYLL